MGLNVREERGQVRSWEKKKKKKKKEEKKEEKKGILGKKQWGRLENK